MQFSPSFKVIWESDKKVAIKTNGYLISKEYVNNFLCLYQHRIYLLKCFRCILGSKIVNA